MKKISASDIAEMPIDERLQLVEDIWDSIAELPEAVSVPEWHKEELEKRLDAYHTSPTEQAIKIANIETLVTEGMESEPGRQTMEALRKKARAKASSK